MLIGDSSSENLSPTSFATRFLTSFAVRIAATAIALGVVYGLATLGEHSRAGVPIGLLLLVVVPVASVWILFIRLQRLVRLVKRLFS
jgi:hypothetical protein